MGKDTDGFDSNERRPVVISVLIGVVLWFLVVLGISFALSVQAEGTVYEFGKGMTHQVGCTPPTTRTDGTPITHDELAFNNVYVRKDDGSEFVFQTDIYCNHELILDELSTGQWRIYADTVDTDGLSSIISVSNAPFVLRAPPNAPTGIQ